MLFGGEDAPGDAGFTGGAETGFKGFTGEAELDFGAAGLLAAETVFVRVCADRSLFRMRWFFNSHARSHSHRIFPP